MSTTAAPVDTVGGQDMKGNVGEYIFSKSGLGNRTFVKRFVNTYEHYLKSDGADGECPKVGILTNATVVNNQRCWQVQHTMSPIPYFNLGAATQVREWCENFRDAGRVRVLKLGYRIKDIQFIEQRLKSVASTTTLENNFISKPRVMVYADPEHRFDMFLGRGASAQSTTALEAKCLFAQYTELSTGHPRTKPMMMETFAYLNYGVDSWKMARSIPNSFLDGQMPICAWYLPCWDTTQCNTSTGIITNGENRYSAKEIQDFTHPAEVLHGIPLGDSGKHDFMWHNPAPNWIGVAPTQFFWQSGTALDDKWKSIGIGWPQSRQEACEFAYRKTILDDTRDVARMPASVSGGWNVTGTDGAPVGEVNFNTMTESHSYRPPIHYLHIPPIYTPVDEMQVSAKILIEYVMEVEIEKAFTFNGGVYANDPFANSNMQAKAPICWHDPLSTTGNLSNPAPYF